MSNSEQDQIELETASLEHAIVMGEAWKRLQRNGDFKRIITEGYLKDKVLASVSLLAVPQIKQRGERPEVMEDLVAASNLQYFFKVIEHQYEGAMNPILSDDEEKELADLELAEQADSLKA
jgi:hypothetical protein